MAESGTYLDKIIAAKRAELAGGRTSYAVRDLDKREERLAWRLAQLVDERQPEN